jgi:hypothetical protein
MTPATAIVARFAAMTSRLMSMCCQPECGRVYGVPRRVDPQFAGVSHGYCGPCERAIRAQYGLPQREVA